MQKSPFALNLTLSRRNNWDVKDLSIDLSVYAWNRKYEHILKHCWDLFWKFKIILGSFSQDWNLRSSRIKKNRHLRCSSHYKMSETSYKKYQSMDLYLVWISNFKHILRDCWDDFLRIKIWEVTELNKICFQFKGIVHPKMKMLSSFTHPQVVPNLYKCLCSAEHKGVYSEESL